MADPIRIGSLRWLLWLVTRDQVADPSGTGIIETAANGRQVHADVEGIVMIEVWNGGRQVEKQSTHLITTRWLDYIDNTKAFIRQTRRPSDGAVRTEVFRVSRVMEIGGRKRFMKCECILEDFGWIAQASGTTVPLATVPPLDSNGNTVGNTGLLP